MAAHILIYHAGLVPVGDDQRQHLELTRNLAQRFNNRFGETFVVPEAVIPRLGARIYDLQEPANKMSKSADSPRGTVMVFDPPEVIEKKVKRAVTDPQTNVRYDPEHKPGVSNLLTILAVSTGRTPEELADEYTEYGPLKTDTAAALVEFLRPVRERYTELAEGGGEGLRRVGRLELEAHLLGDAHGFVAGAGGPAVAAAEPLAGDAELGRPGTPATEGEEGGGARFEGAEDAEVVGDGVGGAHGEDLGIGPPGHGQADGGADRRAAGA